MHQGIQKSKEYIHSQLQEELPLEVLADIACMSPVHFHRKFKAATGYTPALYVRLQKIGLSLDLLRESVETQQQLQVQDLAALTGFANYETFSRAFCRHVGIAPSELQALLYQLQQQADPNKPLVVAGSTDLLQLQELAKDALNRNIFQPDQISELQVCLIGQQDIRSRKVNERYQLQFDQALSRQLIEQLTP